MKPDLAVKATSLAELLTQSDLWGAAQDLDGSMIRVRCLGTVACTFLRGDPLPTNYGSSRICNALSFVPLANPDLAEVWWSSLTLR